MDYDRALPIVTLTLDVRWDPGEHYDDHGELVIAPPSMLPKAQMSVHDTSRALPLSLTTTTLSSWTYTETCTIFHPPGSTDSGEHESFYDAVCGKDRVFDGRVFPIALSSSITQKETPPPACVRAHTPGG